MKPTVIPSRGETRGGTDQLLTAREVALYLHICPKKVYDLPIPQVRISDRRIRFIMKDVTDYVQHCRRSR
jgi:hypothetical protein